MLRAFAEWLLGHRRGVAIAGVLLIPLLAMALARLRFDFSLDPILVANDEQLRQVVEFQDKVPPRLFDVIFTASWSRPIEAAELERLGEAVDALEDEPDVREAFAASNAPVIPSGATLPLPVPFPTTLGDATVLDAVARHPLLANRLIARDGRSAAVLIAFDQPLGSRLPVARTRQLQDLFGDALGPEVEVRRVGGDVVEQALSSSMLRDLLRSIALEFVLCSILLVIVFRTPRGALVPLGTVALALLASLAVLAALGYRISLLDLAIPGLVTIIGLCDAVHLLHRFEEGFAELGDRRAAIVDMLERVGVACFHTSLTTAIGFLSLVAADHVAVREFGIKAGIAVAITYLVVMIALPLVLSVWPMPARGSVAAVRPWRVPAFRARTTYLMFTLLTLLALAGASRLSVDSKWLEELPQDAPEVVNLRWFERNFTGLLSLDVRLRGRLDTPEAFRAVEGLQAAVLAAKDVMAAESYTLWVREALGNPDRLTDDDIRRGIARLRLMGARFPRHVIDPAFENGCVAFRTSDIGTRRFLQLTEQIDVMAREFPGAIRGRVAGYARMAHESGRLVVTTMLKSVLLSLAVISLFIAIVFRSIRAGLVALLPNVFPIVVAVGLNGWLDIPVRIGIVMIYSLGLGLAVDDTLHLLARFFQERRRDPAASSHECMQRSLRGTGRALIVSSLILSAGCVCYLRSEFRSMIDVGILLNAVVISALLADLFLLPHLIERLFRRGQSSDSSRAVQSSGLS